jgi:hypothetical protein
MFKNSTLEQKMNNFGFVETPFLDNSETSDLMSLYKSNFEGVDINGLYVNHNQGSPEKASLISKEILRITTHKLNLHFNGFKPFIAHFAVKKNNTTSEFPLHQDWCIIDESKHKCYHIWISLDFSNFYNGGLFVLPHSHLFFNNIRSGSFGITRVESCLKIKPLLYSPSVAQGSAVIWNSKTFHGSHPNLSEKNRTCIVISIVEKDAQAFYFNRNNNNKKKESYPINSSMLLQNLYLLEKGEIPDDWVYDKNENYQQLENNTINCEMLVKKYLDINNK